MFNSDFLTIKLNSKESYFEIELIRKKQDPQKLKVTIQDRENYLRCLKEWVSCIINN